MPKLVHTFWNFIMLLGLGMVSYSQADGVLRPDANPAQVFAHQIPESAKACVVRLSFGFSTPTVFLSCAGNAEQSFDLVGLHENDILRGMSGVTELMAQKGFELKTQSESAMFAQSILMQFAK